MAGKMTETHSWSVVATVSEPAALVLAFVAHALSCGAQAVHLYLDRPDPGLAAALATRPEVSVTVCDAAYWRDVPGGRPWPTAMRQRINLQAALDAARTDWILHVDADEFLWGPPDIGQRLAALPGDVDHAIVFAAERVHSGAVDSRSIFAGRFRRQIHDPALQPVIDRIDGPSALFLRRGMAGYAGGKSFFRTGRGLRAGIHVPDNADPARMHALTDFDILHFDGLTPLAWAQKKMRKIAQQPEWRSFPEVHKATRNQLAAVHAAAGDPTRLRQIYATIKVLDPAREAALQAAGLLFDADLQAEARVSAAFPGGAHDFSAAAFETGFPRYRGRRDLQTLKHAVRAVVARATGRPPRP